jgi:hypothetical protein
MECNTSARHCEGKGRLRCHLQAAWVQHTAAANTAPPPPHLSQQGGEARQGGEHRRLRGEAAGRPEPAGGPGREGPGATQVLEQRKYVVVLVPKPVAVCEGW